MAKKLSFWPQPNRKREREREREREKQSSLFDSHDFVDRISLGQELKLLYAKSSTRGYRNHKISSRFKVWVFTEFDEIYVLARFRETIPTVQSVSSSEI